MTKLFDDPMAPRSPRTRNRRFKFGTSIRQVEKRFLSEFGSDHPPHPLFSSSRLQVTMAEIHAGLRDGARDFREGKKAFADTAKHAPDVDQLHRAGALL